MSTGRKPRNKTEAILFAQMVNLINQIDKVEETHPETDTIDVEQIIWLSEMHFNLKQPILESLWKIFPKETDKLLTLQSYDWTDMIIYSLLEIGSEDQMSISISYPDTTELSVDQFPYLDEYRKLVVRLEKRKYNIGALQDIYSNILTDIEDFMDAEFDDAIETFHLHDYNNLLWYAQFLMEVQENYIDELTSSISLGESMMELMGDFLIDADSINDRLLEIKGFAESYHVKIAEKIEFHFSMSLDDDNDFSVSIESAQAFLDSQSEILDLEALIIDSPDRFQSQFVVLFAGIDTVYTLTHFIGQIDEVVEDPDNTNISMLDDINLSWAKFPEYLGIAETRWQPILVKYSDEDFKKLCINLVDEIIDYIKETVEDNNLVNYQVITLKKTLVDWDRVGIQNKSGLKKQWRRKFGNTMIRELDRRIHKNFGFSLMRMDMNEEEYIEENIEIDYRDNLV